MRKVFLVLASVFALSAANAQSGNNQVGIGVDLGLPTGDYSDAFKLGIGGYAKYLHGVGSAGQITFTTGYQSFKGKESTDDYSYSMNVIPLLAGYRHNFNGLFVEPQLGMGIYGAKVKVMGESESESETKFTYGIGAGYAKSGFEVGVRYQAGSLDPSFGQIGFRVGYNFSLGGGSASK